MKAFSNLGSLKDAMPEWIRTRAGMESAVGSNPCVLSFLGFLCKGLAPSFWNTKSTPLVSWFPLIFVRTTPAKTK